MSDYEFAALLGHCRWYWLTARLCSVRLSENLLVPLPRADVILSRDGLVHLSLADCLAALRNFKHSQSGWLLATTFIHFPANSDIATGGWRQLNLQKPPFDFPPPHRLIDEKCLHSGGIYADKRLGLWELKTLAV